MLMPAKRFSHVAVHAEIVEEIISLEDTVMLDHPMRLLVNKGLQDRRRNVGMVVAAKRVADVVQQGGDDIALALALAVGSGRGLQAVLQPVDRKAAIITV